MTVREHEGLFCGEDRSDDYEITVGASTPRRFVGLKMEMTWEFENKTCYYVGNTQGGRLSEASGDTVIEGMYADYKVDSLFDTQYVPYGQFDEDLCSGSDIPA